MRIEKIIKGQKSTQMDQIDAYYAKLGSLNQDEAIRDSDFAFVAKRAKKKDNLENYELLAD